MQVQKSDTGLVATARSGNGPAGSGWRGYFGSSAWGRRLGKEKSIVWMERTAFGFAFQLGTGEGEGGTRARSWKRKGEMELGKNKPGKEPILKVTRLGSSSPLPHPKTQALGHRVW